ncbi:hypothetical protein HNQ51_003716 [Inhella inkyongensis]|uniref:Uncharacterized protein n=1 Tax=Inhella inkyongensis TaxID=392593 RepID=A0A840SDF7_9BURK|nr:hypothetical protein [Inhella inkyongensis]MBB5206370.1 hypothetical protein [Inhella inkyongensis]
MSARIETEKLRRLQLGVKFWRPSAPQVTRALEAADRAGLSRQDLRLLALNKDVRVSNGEVEVRRSTWPALLGLCGLVIVILGWAYLVLLVLASPAGIFAKGAGVALISLIFWFLWPGFSIYTLRAHKAVEQAGAEVEELARRGPRTHAAVQPLRKD